MKLDYKSLGRKLTVISIVCLSATVYYGEVLAGSPGGNGNSCNGKGQVWGNFLGDHSNLMNASDISRDQAAYESAVVLPDPNHILDFPGHYDADGNHIDGLD